MIYSVEFVCPWCQHEIQIARCSVDVDADTLVRIYFRDILLGHMRCPACGDLIFDPAAVARVNRPRDDETRAPAGAEGIDLAALLTWLNKVEKRTLAEIKEVAEARVKALSDLAAPPPPRARPPAVTAQREVFRPERDRPQGAIGKV